MPPDLWFDPSGGLFGVPPAPGIEPTGTGGTGGTVCLLGPTGYICGPANCQVPAGFVPATLPPGYQVTVTFLTGPDGCEWRYYGPPVGGSSGGGVTLPAGLGGGSGEIIPPATSGNGTCPQCGCVTCQCQSQPSETPQRSCYLLPNGQYVWLTQSDEVPADAQPCSGVTPIQPEQPPPATTPVPTEFPAGEDQQDAPAPPCITQFPFGSPDWCKCAELWRQRFAEIGNRLVFAWRTGDYQGNGLLGNVFAFITAIVGNKSDLSLINPQSALDFMQEFISNIDRLMGDMYSPNQWELLGISYTRAMVEALESLHVDLELGDETHESVGVGVNVLVTSLNVGLVNNMTRAAHGALSFKLPEVKRVLDQLARYFAPTDPAPISMGLSVFAAGGIDLDGLRCNFQANGLHPNWAEPAALAERARPLPLEWISYWRRGKITDQQLATVLRGNGYLLPDEQQVLVTVSEVIPPPTDLVRFMLRSIGDPQVVQRFQLEAEFDQLYQGRIKDWGKANGITEEVLRGYHAAHWVVPGPADLATFWQRFGEQRDSPAANKLPQKMSAQDYDRALREQGVAPFWRPYFIAAQYSVASRRDLQYAYQIGAYSQTELLDSLLDIGYSPSVAPRIKKIILSRAVEFWAKDPIVSAYKKNGINQIAMEQYLQDRGCPAEIRSEVVRMVRIEATEIANEKLIGLIEKQFELGQLDDTGLVAALTSMGLDADQINRIVLNVKDQKKVRPKQLPAAELCRMYGSLLISRTEFLARLVTLNYTPNDAELIVSKCELDLEARQLKQLQMLMKQQAAAERRQLKDMQLAERQAQLAKARDAKALAAQIKAQRAATVALEREQAKAKAATERAIARAATLAKQAEAEELRIQSLIEHIANHWAKATGSDPVSAASDLIEAVQTATAEGTYTVSEILRAVESRLVSGTKDYPAQLADLVTETLPLIAQATAIAPEQPANGEAPAQPIGPASQ